MRAVASGLAEDLFSWRSQESSSGMQTIGKRVIVEIVAIPSVLAVAVVESAVRGVFVGFSYLGDCCGDCGSVDLFKESLHLIPIMGLSLLDNIYAKTLDKDNECLIGAYAKYAFHENED